MIPLPHARRGEGRFPRWNMWSDYLFHTYGERVQKIPLDAGFSCPNRDGTLSSGGCVFCNPLGSGSGLGRSGLSLARQWQRQHAHLHGKGIRLFIAYLQSYSNTYGPVAQLAAVLAGLKELPGIMGLAVGTRPDCVDPEKIRLIADTCEQEAWPERWIEFGVQSSNNATLSRIRRGHDLAVAEAAIALAAAAGLKVCVHLIAGLPGEGKADFLESVRWASRQGISGIKLHCLYVCKGSALVDAYEKGAYRPLTQAEYVDMVAEALPLLRADIIMQRITGAPDWDELLAPPWAVRSRDTANKILAELRQRETWQGKNSA
jgi:radical SAM protein (TIGR01212 family)